MHFIQLRQWGAENKIRVMNGTGRARRVKNKVKRRVGKSRKPSKARSRSRSNIHNKARRGKSGLKPSLQSRRREKPGWDDSISDLSRYRLSSQEQVTSSHRGNAAKSANNSCAMSCRIVKVCRHSLGITFYFVNNPAKFSPVHHFHSRSKMPFHCFFNRVSLIIIIRAKTHKHGKLRLKCKGAKHPRRPIRLRTWCNLQLCRPKLMVRLYIPPIFDHVLSSSNIRLLHRILQQTRRRQILLEQSILNPSCNFSKTIEPARSNLISALKTKILHLTQSRLQVIDD